MNGSTLATWLASGATTVAKRIMQPATGGFAAGSERDCDGATFLPRGAKKELAKQRAHDEGLTTLLKPLEALTKDERAAINADGACGYA